MNKTIIGINRYVNKKGVNSITIYFTEPFFSSAKGAAGVQCSSVWGYNRPEFDDLEVGDVIGGFALGEPFNYNGKKIYPLVGYLPSNEG